MENGFTNRDFEKFVQQNADQYRMFPTEKVWKGIHSALHTRRRWYAIGLTLLLLTTATVTWVMLLPGDKNESLASGNQSLQKQIQTSVPLSSTNKITGPAKSSSNNSSFITSPTGLQENIFGSDLPPAEDNNRDNSVSRLSLTNTEEPAASPVMLQTGSDAKVITANNNNTTILSPVAKAPAFTNARVPGTVTESVVQTVQEKKAEAPAITGNTTTYNELKPPFTIESVVNSYEHRRTKNKLQWFLYFTPTISYRQLEENTQFLAAARYNSIVSPGTVNSYDYSFDVNSMVNHKPDLGMQLGLRANYPVSKWFSFTGGLQFNVSKYDIQAYSHSPETATIALSTAGGGTNTITPISSYRNKDGSNANWLRNFYFSASIPIGMELKLSDGMKNYFGVASSIQPTYVLDNRAYLISTDYKNYAQVPSLTRHWNLSTSFEVFAATRIRGTEFRVSPQIRYQLMSSFVKDYPIKEHLFDFGIKLGVRLK